MQIFVRWQASTCMLTFENKCCPLYSWGRQTRARLFSLSVLSASASSRSLHNVVNHSVTKLIHWRVTYLMQAYVVRQHLESFSSVSCSVLGSLHRSVWTDISGTPAGMGKKHCQTNMQTCCNARVLHCYFFTIYFDMMSGMWFEVC